MKLTNLKDIIDNQVGSDTVTNLTDITDDQVDSETDHSHRHYWQSGR